MRTRKLDHDLVFTWLAPAVLAGLLSACGGGGDGGGGGSETGAGGASAGAPPPRSGHRTGRESAPAPAADTGRRRAQTPVKPAGGGGGGGGGGDAKLIALGDSIFHGQAGGGTCYVCHGQDAKGSAVAPNLTDGEWLNNDGTLAGITGTIKSGVPQPKKAPAPMPPMGGASLSDGPGKSRGDLRAFALGMAGKTSRPGARVGPRDVLLRFRPNSLLDFEMDQSPSACQAPPRGSGGPSCIQRTSRQLRSA